MIIMVMSYHKAKQVRFGLLDPKNPGFWSLPEINKEHFTNDGWLKTGDWVISMSKVV